jgi:hypothetical protein
LPFSVFTIWNFRITAISPSSISVIDLLIEKERKGIQGRVFLEILKMP